MLKKIFNKFDDFMTSREKKLGYYLLIITIILIATGCVFVYSSSSINAYIYENNINYYFSKQAIFAVIGLCAMASACFCTVYFYKKFFYFIYGAVISLLVLVHFVGIGGDQVGATSWIRIGGFGLQPSELGKIAGVMAFAYFLEKKAFDYKKDIKMTIFALFLTVLPIVLVLMEPDLGSVAVMATGLVAVLFFTEIPLKFFVLLGLTGAAGLSVFMTFAGYRMARIEAFLHPFDDPLGISYQIVQSFYAIANGGVFGQGIGGSKQKFMWLPEQHTDFIYAIITEELGFVGATLIVLLFLSLLVVVIYMGLSKKQLFQRYVIIGLGTMLVFQAFLNIMVVTGLFPVTGITLPFISYGGSSMISSCLTIGIIFSLYYD